jgi:hypothetical protein
MRDTIDMAREAGFYMPEDESYYEAFADDIKRFEALVRADERSAEREACAKVCDELPLVEGAKQVQRATLKDAATAIRARGVASTRRNT